MNNQELDLLRKENECLRAKLANTEADLELSEMSVTTLSEQVKNAEAHSAGLLRALHMISSVVRVNGSDGVKVSNALLIAAGVPDDCLIKDGK